MHVPLSVIVILGLFNPQKVFVFNSSVNYSFLLLGLMGLEQWCTLQWCMSVSWCPSLVFFNSRRGVWNAIVSGVIIIAIGSVAIWAGACMLMACMSTA